MHLKRLELCGFKSFADRIHLDLGPGLNGVVGPNGSGKSNIADALRWVLGEQSAKQLRGGKMEDIIFAGTAHRKPLSYAEIIMRLDNSDGKLPLEFKEISVTRRVYRSGESEYAINGESCRLKDIQMLFMDTGIGRDGYSIVGQGRIDEILSLRSEDRRLVFEEAAGIGKFKARRNEASSKLEKERQNRARIDDIILELDEQIEPLFTQSEEAKRFLNLRDQYKNVHINIFLGEIRRIEQELIQTEETMQNSQLQAQAAKQQLSEARQQGEGLKSRATNMELQYRRASEALLEITKTIEKKESDGKLINSQLTQMETERNRIKSEISKRELTILAKSEEHTKENKNKANAQAELDELNSQLTIQLELSSKRDEALKESSTTLDSYNQAVMDAMNLVTESHAAILEAEAKYHLLEERKERLDTEFKLHETQIQEQETQKQHIESTLKTCTSKFIQAENSLKAYTTAHNQLTESHKNLETEIRQLQETLTTTRGNFRALSNLESQYEGYYRSVKFILRKRTSDIRFSGICGTVSELLNVERKYEIAIETALGGAAQNIITKTEDDAKLAIETLKQTKEGRATFLPLIAVRGRTIDTYRYKHESGFIGLASELITYEPVYAQAMAQLLGDILIFDTMDNALAVNKKNNYSLKIVTLDGERLSPGGAIMGGSRQTTGIIGRGQQLETLKNQVETLEANLTKLNGQERQLKTKQQATEETLSNSREQVQMLNLEIQNSNNKLIQIDENLQKFIQKSQQLNNENDTIMEKLAESNITLHIAEKAKMEKELAVQEARNALEKYQQEMEQNRQEHSEEADTLTELHVKISQRTEWVSQAQSNIKRLERENKTLQEEKRLLLEEILTNEKSTELAIQEREDIIEKVSLLQSQLENIQTDLSNIEKDKSTIDKELSQIESNERQQSDATSLLDKELTRLEMRKEQLDSTSRRLHNEIWEEYNITYQQALLFKRDDVTDSALRRESQELRNQLSTLTNVNVGAIEAYTQMKSRHDFLTNQREDILMAEKSIQELIQNLTSQMETQFLNQFQLIAVHFSEVFKEMFGGGKADLRLTDIENVLESGIEITAQPPGKALQNLMLLSGGERALTAIALLFAILRLKPSPFCVLDEIESALDDANVARFAKFLKEYALGTQFIIITHRRGTMEAADHLYGVTMEEQGISKLVSVSFV